MDKVTDWLITQEPWVRYRTHIELLGRSQNDPDVQEDFAGLMKHSLIEGLLKELHSWPGQAMKRHNDAKLLYHKLVFLADLGLNADCEELHPVLESILAHQSMDGPFQIIVNIPLAFGGNGMDEFSWMLCDAPLLNYALLRLGVDDPRVLRSTDYLLKLEKENGWPCAASSTLGSKFKGPGRRTDPCPYANLIMMRMLSAMPGGQDHPAARTGAEMLLGLWERRKEKKYFLFGMGTDFAKLKAPFIWFDILHVAHVLSCFEFLKEDPRLLEMLDIIRSKADENGLYKAESAYRAWSEWDFGQKKGPSGWITLLVYSLLKRMNAPTIQT